MWRKCREIRGLGLCIWVLANSRTHHVLPDSLLMPALSSRSTCNLFERFLSLSCWHMRSIFLIWIKHEVFSAKENHQLVFHAGSPYGRIQPEAPYMHGRTSYNTTFMYFASLDTKLAVTDKLRHRWCIYSKKNRRNYCCFQLHAC